MPRHDIWATFARECLPERSCADEESLNCSCGGETHLDDGANVCSLCGKMQPTIDMSAEWRFYGDEGMGSNPTRCGMPINPLLMESSLGCKVMCSGTSSYEMRKIRRYTEWQSMPYKEKSQYDEFQHITAMASISGIPKMIIDSACRYHKKISEKQTFRGDNRDGIIAASIYIACRVENYPRTAKEIAHIFHLDYTSATRGCKNAMTILNEFDVGKVKFPSTSPHSFIDRYCSHLKMSKEMTRMAEFIALRIEKINLIPENTPHSVAAGIVYFVAHDFKLGISKQEIKLHSGISEVTINKCYKKIEAVKLQLLPPEVYAAYAK
jgi:transcription initiation factor TFIIB